VDVQQAGEAGIHQGTLPRDLGHYGYPVLIPAVPSLQGQP
jgi:hypothetical protein